MPQDKSTVTTKVATLALPTREAHVVATVWPGPRGMLLFLSELNLAPQTRQEFLQNINSELERAWQESKNMPGSADAVLENIVLSINQILSGQERLMGNPLSPRYQLLLAYISGQQIALSNLGHIDAFVISANKLSNALVSASGKKAPKPSSTFDNLISGEILPGESLLLATSTLTDYFSWDRLRTLIPSRPPGQSLREIEKYMLQLKIHPPLGLICLKLSLASEIEGTGESMDHLLKTKAQTASLLQPKLVGYIKSKISRHKPEPDSYAETSKPVSQIEKASTPSLKEKPRGGFTLFAARLGRFIKKLSWLTSRESAKSTIAWWLESNLAKWRRLNKSKRALFLLGVALILAFSQSIVNLGKNNLKASNSEYYNQLVTQITEKQAAIEGALIYGDNDKALTLYNEAKSYLAELPRNSSSREVQWQSLSQNLSLLARRLQYLNEITDPAVWSQLPPAPENEHWQNLTVVGDKIFVTASGKQLLLLANDGKVSATKNLPAELVNIKKSIPSNNELLLVTQDNKLASYQISSGQTVVLDQTLEIQDGNFYGDGLYFLSQKDRTIWRTSRTNKGFSSPVIWLKANQSDLTKAEALAVDGSIYVAKSDLIEKFTRGSKQNFELKPVNPPLNAITSLFTNNDSDYLYAWEQTNKRLVAYDKTGKLIIQLILPTLNNITTVTVDDTNKAFLVLSGNTIYRIPILESVAQ